MTLFTSTTLIEMKKGWTVKLEQVEIISGVTLKVYDDKEATLIIGSNELEFVWCDDAKALFRDIDTCEPIELLAILTDNQKALAN